MKVEAECAGCIVSRAVAEATEATTNPALRFRAVAEVLRLLNREFRPTAVPADLGTKRDRLIKKITGNGDPYERLKGQSNRTALKLLPYAREIVEDGYNQQDRFKRASLCAIVGNVMEFGIPSHRFTFGSVRKLLREAARDLAIDDTNKIYATAKSANRVLYLTDNAGEIVFDTVLVEQLKSMGIAVTVAVKSEPIINDATYRDAETSGMTGVADRVITTGTDAVGLVLKESSEEFAEAYNSAHMIFAKGMGYAETLTECRLTRPHVLLFRTKCDCVANYFGVPCGKNVAKMMP